MRIPAATANGGGIAARAVAACLGLLALAWPVPWLPLWAYALAGVGSAAVLAAAAGRRSAATVAAVAAIAACAASRAGSAALAAEGMFILGYLLAADAPASLSGRAAARWAGMQVPLLAAGLAAAGVVLAAVAVRPAASAWIVLAGLAAAVAAYLAALSGIRR
jgi:hypothetical protein